ncbi:MAG TPA: polysaccharide pyruvyl transferase family protein [Tepidisphaeraceae bacterium]|nr:polysaccharide pyruvyl transferase family protein [Tepidisphaeraceae bacterium]
MLRLISTLRNAVSRPTPGIRLGERPRPRVAFMTTVHLNVGDEFIREGIRSFLDEVIGEYDPFYVHKHDIDTLHTPLLDEGELLQDKFRDADLIVQAGAPVYWNFGPHQSYNVGWAKDLWFDRIFQLGPGKPILNIGAGSCQPREDDLAGLMADPQVVDFAKQAGRACRWTCVRDPLASRFLESIEVEHELLPCPAFHAARRTPGAKITRNVLAVNLMRDAGHHLIKPENDPARWHATVQAVIPRLREKYRLLFVAHDDAEAQYQRQFARDGEMVFHSNDFRDYLSLYASVTGIFANRVHGAVAVAGFGRPAVIVGTDSRVGIARPIGIPAVDEADATPDWMDHPYARPGIRAMEAALPRSDGPARILRPPLRRAASGIILE